MFNTMSGGEAKSKTNRQTKANHYHVKCVSCVNTSYPVCCSAEPILAESAPGDASVCQVKSLLAGF